MNNNPNAAHIRQCIELIEARWQRGSSTEWTSYDFEKLSEDIFEATRISISISTLKRLFGKANYQNLPSVHTLNTLARYIGFEDWNAFKRRDGLSVVPEVVAPTRSTAPAQKIFPAKQRMLWWVLFLPAAGLAYIFLSSTKVTRPGPVDASAYTFSCNKVLTEGVPNSVVFRYDASAASTDSVFIVQDWDVSRRTQVSRTGQAHSAIYYYPGYFNAKLIVDKHIVQTHDLMISSGGWLAMAEGEPAPYYFKKGEYVRRHGEVVVDSALLAKNHLPVPHPWIRISYVKDLGDLPNDNFAFETTLRSDRSDTDACQHVEVLILCKNDIIIFPLASRGCVGDISLYAAGKEVTSKEADLSGFGSDLTRWTSVKIETVGKHMQFTVNDKPAYFLDFPNTPTDIVGVQFRFRGGGSVRDTRFSARGRTIELR